MNDATKRIGRKSSVQDTSLRAGTSGQAVKQAIRESMSEYAVSAGNAAQSDLSQTQSALGSNGKTLRDGDRRALFSSISLHGSTTESGKTDAGGTFDD